MKKTAYLSFILCLLSFYASEAQVFSNDFLNIGYGARAQALSGAVSATARDVSASYWNPAGLSGQESPLSIAGMHAEWFAGIAKYDFIGISKTLNAEKESVGGISVVRFGIDNIPNTLNLVNADGSINYDNVYSFSAADYAVLLSYAQRLGKKGSPYSIGGNVKIINRNVGEFAQSWGFGLDIGLRYQKNNWMAGALLRDATGTFNAWSFNFTDAERATLQATGNLVPESSIETTRPTLILGGAYRWNFNQTYSLLTSVDAWINTDGQRNVLISSKTINIDPRVGLEFSYKNLVFLRGGVGKFQRQTDDIDVNKKTLSVLPTFGVGLKLGRFHIDYAQTDIGNSSALLYSNIFSLQLDFAKRKTAKPPVE